MPTSEDRTWMDDLPPRERAAMEREIAACNHPEDLEQLLFEWKATARVWADPELARMLTTPLEPEDLIEVPRPQMKDDQDG